MVAVPEEGQEREPGLDPVVPGLREVGVRRCTDDADLVAAVREVVERVEEVERQRRAERGGPVGRGSRALSRPVRLAAMGEIEVALGFSAWEAGLLITAATAEDALARMVDGALRSGEATCVLVRLFYEKTASLEDEQRLLVAAALFGDDPELAAADRLDPEDQLHGGPWSVPRYKAALDAEVAACRGVDVEAERAARARAYAARRAWVRVHDDGTATLSIRGPVASVLGASQRLDRAAKGVHALGDPRLMDQLRADLGLGLLNYGTVALGGGLDKPAAPAPQADHTADGWGATVDDTDVKDGTNTTGDTDSPQDATGDTDGAQGVLFDPVLAPDDMELLARVVNALPAVALQVIVPYAALAGGFPICGHCSGTLERRGSGGGPSPGGDPGPGRDEPPAEDPGEDSARRGPPGRAGRGCGRGRGRGRGRVGEVLGPHPFFVTDGHARELTLMPGTTLHRLVVDPRDGRLVERTIQGYRPDADMRRQVVAADVYSRAPGARVPATAGELDHVTPYGWAGGPTSEANLALLAKRPHQYKTDGTWHVEIGARRDLTFTTLLGQVATTRVHDYRTYLERRDAQDVDDLRDAAGQLLQAALADRARSRGRRARGEDWLTLEHTDPGTGAVRPGPHPDQPTLDELLDGGSDGDGGPDGDGEAGDE